MRTELLIEEEFVDKYQEVLIALRRLIRATDLHSKHLVRTAGLTASQVLILQAIGGHKQATPSQLARDISLSQATITSIVDRLEQRGLIERERSQQDRRRVYLRLTEQGKEVLEQAPAPLQDHFIRQFRQLENWEQLSIISSLQRVAAMMDADGIDASPILDVGSLQRHATE